MNAQTAVIDTFITSLETWMKVNMAEYAQMSEQSDAPDDLRLALCSRWLQVIEDVLQPDAPQLLRLLTDHAMQNIDHWLDQPEADQIMVGHISRLLLGWPQLIHRVLKEPVNDEAVNELLPFLVADCWPVPLDDEQLLDFADELERHRARLCEQVAGSEGNPELFAAFRDELLHEIKNMGSAVELMAVPNAKADIIFHFRNAWQDLLATCEEMERLHPMPALATCCQHFAGHLQNMRVASAMAGQLWAERLDAWSMLFCEALNSESFEDLQVFIDDESIWQDDTQSDEETAEVHAPTMKSFSPSDVDLQPDADVHPTVLQEFFREAEGHTAGLTAVIQQMLSGDCDQPLLAKTQRIAHTLKGAANTTGFSGIANLTHHVEDLIEYLYQQNLSPPQALLILLMEVADCLEVMVEHIQGREETPDNALDLLQQLAHWWQRMQAHEPLEHIAPKPARAKASDNAQNDEPVRVEPSSPPQPMQESEECLHIPYRVVDQLLRQVGEITIALGQMRNRFDQLNNQFEQQAKLEQRAYQIGLELEEQLTAQNLGLVQRQTEQHDDFDPLELDQYNELHSGVSRLLESISDSRAMSEGLQQEIAAMDSHLISRERLQRDLQERILQTRMTPFSTLEMRLQRIVRQTARKTGKLVTLECSGMDLMVDAEVLNRIADSLMHILRNAIDHGIEEPEVREQSGKPRNGTIRLSLSHPAHDVLICCEDDGRGLNFPAIRAKAEAKGLLDAGTSISDEELARLTLHPGFSTRDEVTQISGRGFGLDIVLQTVSELKGRIQLLPVNSGGLRIEIRLPVTLTTIHALLVESEQQSYAIPSRDVVRVLNAGEGEFCQIGNDYGYMLDGKLMPLCHLNHLLWGKNEQADAQAIPLIVRSQEKEHIVLVEHIQSCHELIMKHLGHYFPPMPGISGASILNDSRVVSVLDLPRLLMGFEAEGSASATLSHEQKTYAREKAHETTVMIVDDSLSVRRTLSSLMHDMGYKTVLAIDGMEAIELLEQGLPDIMLLDLELPRMNGLELSSYMRKQAHMQNLPIIMITSRATEKHRQRAMQAGVNHYLVKPYQEDELLAQIERLLATGET